MAVFGKADVTFALDILRIWAADDRYGGVEPYVVPVFFKVDGERYLASLRINHAQAPRPGSTEQVGGQIQIGVDTVATGTSPNDEQPFIDEDNPFIYVPPGDLLKRGELDKGEQVSMKDVAFRTTLSPIPFRIDVRSTYYSIGQALDGLIVPIDEAEDAINFIFTEVSAFIGDLFGLNEVLDRCPPGDLGSSDFLNEIDAQFKAMIPGTIGGVFLCMENDAFDEGLAQDLRSALRDEVASSINDVINALNETNLIPQDNRLIDQDVITDNITSAMTWPVVADIAVSVASTLSLNPVLSTYGLLTGLSWAIGGKDDTIGVVTKTYDQSNLGPAGSQALESQIFDSGGGNRWDLSYTMSVNSIS